MTILVSVASYRDPELVPTVLDCLAKADNPDELRVVVCWQHLGDEDVSAIADDPRVVLLDYDARKSEGACWARAKIMRQYAGEDWFFQVDSHTRFAPGWDTRLIAAARASGADKPLISSYPSSYDPTEEFTGQGETRGINVNSWSHDGLPILGQYLLEAPADRPAPAHFLAAGFIFAPGSLCVEVPYDPYLYFYGEEITLAVRAFTWGYDLFHPTEVLAWHYYIREGATRHWTDHQGASGTRRWDVMDRASRRRVTNLIKYPYQGRFGVGPVRTLADFEAHTGLSFAKRTYTPPQLEAPVPG